jgi:hypothetical protein
LPPGGATAAGSGRDERGHVRPKTFDCSEPPPV